MRSSAVATSSKMPSTGLSIVRVAIKPMTHGTWTPKWVSRSFIEGMPIRVRPAGAGSVCHMASSAANFIFWLSVRA